MRRNALLCPRLALALFRQAGPRSLICCVVEIVWFPVSPRAVEPDFYCSVMFGVRLPRPSSIASDQHITMSEPIAMSANVSGPVELEASLYMEGAVVAPHPSAQSYALEAQQAQQVAVEQQASNAPEVQPDGGMEALQSPQPQRPTAVHGQYHIGPSQHGQSGHNQSQMGLPLQNLPSQQIPQFQPDQGMEALQSPQPQRPTAAVAQHHIGPNQYGQSGPNQSSAGLSQQNLPIQQIPQVQPGQGLEALQNLQLQSPTAVVGQHHITPIQYGQNQIGINQSQVGMSQQNLSVQQIQSLAPSHTPAPMQHGAHASATSAVAQLNQQYSPQQQHVPNFQVSQPASSPSEHVNAPQSGHAYDIVRPGTSNSTLYGVEPHHAIPRPPTSMGQAVVGGQVPMNSGPTLQQQHLPSGQSVQMQSNVQSQQVKPSKISVDTSSHGQPVQANNPVQQPQPRPLRQTSQHAQKPQRISQSGTQSTVHQQPQVQESKPPKKVPSKLSKPPKPPKEVPHRNSTSAISIASVSSLSSDATSVNTPSAVSSGLVSPPSYTPTPVQSQPYMMQQPQQSMSHVATTMGSITYHWYCAYCNVG